MTNSAARRPHSQERPRWSTLSIIIAGSALFIALSGTAVAAKGLIQSKDIARGAVTSKAIRNGTVMRRDLNRSTRRWVQATTGARGATGDAGATGLTGAPGAVGADGADGLDGADGILAPQSATAGLTPLPTASPPTVVVEMTVPAGNYVVWAKTQLSHTGAGDTVDCMLTAGGSTVDQVSMKTLPALAAIPASLQAVTTTSPSHLSLECDVLTADGSANFSSLIAIPTG
jgi:hypothetical protein